MAHRLLVISSNAALLGSLFIASPAWAVTPECETDEDCEAGFDCVITGTSSPGTGGTSGGGSGGSGGAVGVCGDSVCAFDESVDACPADCVEVRSCEPAECQDSSECAEGYFCAAGTPVGTGGSGPLYCGDRICSTDENAETCAEDCLVPSHCEIEWVACGSTADCPDGFYCDLPSSGSGSGGVGAASGGGASGSGGSGGDVGGAGGATGGTASSEFAAPRPEGGSAGLGDPLPGACLPGEGMGGSSGTTGTGGSTGGFGAVSGAAGAVTGGSGPVDGGTGPGGSAGTGAGTGTGATGSGATGGATGSGATNSGGTSGSTANGGMSGEDGDPKSGEHGGGCSYSATSKTSPFGLLLGLALLFGRSRRRNARRA